MASNDELRRANLKRKLPEDAIKKQQLAKAQEIAYRIAVQGEDPSTFLVPAASASTQLGTGQTGNVNTTKYFKAPKNSVDEFAILRISGTGGATPTVTIKIQGATDSGFTSAVTLSSADSATPTTFSTSDVVVTTTGTWTKYRILKRCQDYRYIRVNYSANTNVTALAADIWYFGDAGTLA